MITNLGKMEYEEPPDDQKLLASHKKAKADPAANLKLFIRNAVGTSNPEASPSVPLHNHGRTLAGPPTPGDECGRRYVCYAKWYATKVVVDTAIGKAGTLH